MTDALDGSRIWPEFFGLSSTDFITPLTIDECVARLRESSDPWWSLSSPAHDVAAQTSMPARGDRAAFALEKTLTPADYFYRRNRQFAILLDGTLEPDGTVTRVRCRVRTSYLAYVVFACAGVAALVMMFNAAVAVAAGIGGDAGAWSIAGRVALEAGIVALLAAVLGLNSLERARAERQFLLDFVRECLGAEAAPR